MNIPFQTIDWATVPPVGHPGETGMAEWRTLQLGGLRIRMVTYSANYKADHWCQKGHVIYCIDGEFVSEMQDGTSYLLTPGMSYVVSDGASSHRSVSRNGVKLLIVDGDFLRPDA